MKLPLTRLPFFSSKESAIAAGTTKHVTEANRNICLRFILFVLCPQMTLSRQPAGIVDDRTGRRFLRLRSQPHGTLGCSTVGRAEHCSGMGCARISCLAGLSCQLLRSLFWISIHRQARPLVYHLKMADEVGTAALLSRFVFDRTIS